MKQSTSLKPANRRKEPEKAGAGRKGERGSSQVTRTSPCSFSIPFFTPIAARFIGCIKPHLPFSIPFLAFLTALAAFALYLPAIGFGFAYDSHPIVLNDTFIHQPRHFLDLITLRVLHMDVMDFNRRMNLFSLMIDSLLWGKTRPVTISATCFSMRRSPHCFFFGFTI